MDSLPLRCAPAGNDTEKNRLEAAPATGYEPVHDQIIRRSSLAPHRAPHGARVVLSCHGRAERGRGQGAAGRYRHPHGGRPAFCAGAARGPGGGEGRSRSRPHRLYRGARHLGPARADRPALPRYLRREHRSGAGGGDHRLLGRLRAGFPEPLRSRAAGGDHGTGLSGLSQHPGGARHRAGDDPAHQGRRLDHDGRGHRKGPCGEALARHSCHEPCQSLRHHDRPQGARRTRRDLPPPGAVVRIRRDLSWPDLRRGGLDGAWRPTTTRS